MGGCIDIFEVNRFLVWELEKVDYDPRTWSKFFKESHTAPNIQVIDSAGYQYVSGKRDVA